MAVATHVEGFTTMAGLLPAFAFHAVSSLVGLQLLRTARKPEAQTEGVAA